MALGPPKDVRNKLSRVFYSILPLIIKLEIKYLLLRLRISNSSPSNLYRLKHKIESRQRSLRNEDGGGTTRLQMYNPKNGPLRDLSDSDSGVDFGDCHQE